MSEHTEQTVNIRRRVFQNSATMMVCKFITATVSLVSVPIVITRVGLEGYGTWESLFAISTLSVMFQSVISGTLLWKMSEAFGKMDRIEVNRLARIGITLVLVLFCLIWPLVWISRYRLIEAFNIPATFVSSAVWILPLLVGEMILGGVNDVLGTVLSAYQRLGLATLIQSAALVTTNLIVISGLLMGWRLWSLLIGYTTGLLGAGISLYFVAFHICGPISIRPALPTRNDFKLMSAYASFLMIGSVSMALRDQTDKVILAASASPAWVGHYGIAVRLAGLVLLLSSFFSEPVISAVATLNANGNWFGIKRLYANFTVVVTFLSGAIVVLVAGFFERILAVWIGRKIPEVAPILFILLAGNIVAVMFTGTGSAICKGIGRAGIETIYIGVSLSLNILFKVVLLSLMGAIGTVISSAISWAIGSIVFALILYRILDLPAGPTLRAAAALPVVLISVIVTRWLGTEFQGNSSRLSILLSTVPLVAASMAIYTSLMIGFRIFPLQTARAIGSRLGSRLVFGPSR